MHLHALHSHGKVTSIGQMKRNGVSSPQGGKLQAAVAAWWEDPATTLLHAHDYRKPANTACIMQTLSLLSLAL